MTQDRIYAFVEENMKTIFAYACSRVPHKQEAEDLAGDIIAALLAAAGRIRSEEALFGYVWTIAANTYKKYLRRKSRCAAVEWDENRLGEIPDDEDFTEALLQSERLNRLRRELSLLSGQYRECTVAYYFDGLSCAETAEKLHISLEMVKYYLFKTRKILKEGIGMERTFGEKSYKPSKFEFVTIFSGQFNREYRNLFNRKLPGSVLSSAYYTPMTVRELSVELGVAAVYMEDEVALLEKYGLLAALPGGKYQTALVIFTEGYTREFYRSAAGFCTDAVGRILEDVKRALPRLRALGFIGSGLPDDRLLWPLLWHLMRGGHRIFEERRGSPAPDRLYDGAAGVNYGIEWESSASAPDADPYACDAFAGYAGIDEWYAASFADFGVLPAQNRYSTNAGSVADALHSRSGAFAVFTPRELAEADSILRPQFEAMAELYERLTDCAEALMRVHAPKSVEALVEKIILKTIFFRTVGLIGKCAVDSGNLALPDGDGPVAVYVYKTQEADGEAASVGVQV
ncbi:MAG: sigma-70 family RNA polymerase sigma factor [Clostridiales bacterium]|nr:sigma-70 family RNA polymerase sigma factor [Clostridiales bacterium]